MKYTTLLMATLVGLLTLNGCMLKHMMGDDDGMSMHDGMPMHQMMHASDDEEDTPMTHKKDEEGDDY